MGSTLQQKGPNTMWNAQKLMEGSVGTLEERGWWPTIWLYLRLRNFLGHETRKILLKPGKKVLPRLEWGFASVSLNITIFGAWGVLQWVGCLLSIPHTRYHVPSTWETEQTRSSSTINFTHGEFEASLNYMRPCLRWDESNQAYL